MPDPISNTPVSAKPENPRGESTSRSDEGAVSGLLPQPRLSYSQTFEEIQLPEASRFTREALLPQRRSPLDIPMPEMPGTESFEYLNAIQRFDVNADHSFITGVDKAVATYNRTHGSTLKVLLNGESATVLHSQLVDSDDLRSSLPPELDVHEERTLVGQELVIVPTRHDRYPPSKVLEEAFVRMTRDIIAEKLLWQNEAAQQSSDRAPLSKLLLSERIQGQKLREQCQAHGLYQNVDAALQRFMQFHEANGGENVTDLSVLRDFARDLGLSKSVPGWSLPADGLSGEEAVALANRVRASYVLEDYPQGKKSKRILKPEVKEAVDDVTTSVTRFAARNLVGVDLPKNPEQERSPLSTNWDRNGSKTLDPKDIPRLQDTASSYIDAFERYEGVREVRCQEVLRDGSVDREIVRCGARLFSAEAAESLPSLIKLKMQFDQRMMRNGAQAEKILSQVLLPASQ